MAMAMPTTEKKKSSSKTKAREEKDITSTQPPAIQLKQNLRSAHPSPVVRGVPVSSGAESDRALRLARKREEEKALHEKRLASAKHANETQNLLQRAPTKQNACADPESVSIELTPVTDLASITNDPDAPQDLKNVLPTVDEQFEQNLQRLSRMVEKPGPLTDQETVEYIEGTQEQLQNLNHVLEVAKQNTLTKMARGGGGGSGGGGDGADNNGGGGTSSGGNGGGGPNEKVGWQKRFLLWVLDKATRLKGFLDKKGKKHPESKEKFQTIRNLLQRFIDFIQSKLGRASQNNEESASAGTDAQTETDVSVNLHPQESESDVMLASAHSASAQYA